nr:hypothetical protein CFP56_12824 [Quercus suber]
MDSNGEKTDGEDENPEFSLPQYIQLIWFGFVEVFTIEVEHQSEDVGGHHPTLDHLVHASFLRDQGVVAREGPLKEEAVATAAAVVRHCCLVNHR